MNGNIALSMEIGSAYALQVCLLQVPALVAFTAVHTRYLPKALLASHSFSMSDPFIPSYAIGLSWNIHLTEFPALIFPQWDMVTVILCVFLLSYTVGEGKSNYFKGSMLILAYLVVLVGFFFTSYNNVDTMGVDPHDTLALGRPFSQSFKTNGRYRNGMAY